MTRNNIVNNQEQYGQQNIVQARFHQYCYNNSCTTAVQQKAGQPVTIVDENKLEQYFAAHIVPGPEQC